MYLAGKLASHTPQTVVDYQKVRSETKLHIHADSAINYAEELTEFYGQGWEFYAPSKANPEFEYICRIIKAVKAGFEQLGKPDVKGAH